MRSKVFDVMIGTRVAHWVANGLDQMRRPGQSRSDIVRQILQEAVLRQQEEE